MGQYVVALRASTGKLVWGFQVVHHDLWDYEAAAQPLLFSLKEVAQAQLKELTKLEPPVRGLVSSAYGLGFQLQRVLPVRTS